MDRHLRRSRRQEDRVAKQRNGQKTIGSGNGVYDKGDVKDDHFLTEAKTTEKKSFPLKQSDWVRIKKQASKKGLMPCMDIEIDNTDNLTVLKTADFIWLINNVDWSEE